MRKMMGILMVCMLMGCSSKEDVFHTRYSGTLELTEHVLGAKIAGRVDALSVKEGDVVKANQVIATLDRYAQAKRDYERTVELFKTGGATAQGVEYAQLAMEDQQVISPINGVVLLRTVEVGEIVPAGAGIVVVGNPKDQWVKIFLAEGVIGQVKMGQKAHVFFDGSEGRSYAGHISFIATKGEFTPRNLQSKEDRMTQVFAVKVALDHPDEHVHPGIAADVTFTK